MCSMLTSLDFWIDQRRDDRRRYRPLGNQQGCGHAPDERERLERGLRAVHRRHHQGDAAASSHSWRTCPGYVILCSSCYSTTDLRLIAVQIGELNAVDGILRPDQVGQTTNIRRTRHRVRSTLLTSRHNTAMVVSLSLCEQTPDTIPLVIDPYLVQDIQRPERGPQLHQRHRRRRHLRLGPYFLRLLTHE